MSKTIYNHAFSIGFSLESTCEDGSSVTNEMLLRALLKRIADCSTGEDSDLVECCDAPMDSYEMTHNECVENNVLNARLDTRNRLGLTNKEVGIE